MNYPNPQSQGIILLILFACLRALVCVVLIAAVAFAIMFTMPIGAIALSLSGYAGGCWFPRENIFNTLGVLAGLWLTFSIIMSIIDIRSRDI